MARVVGSLGIILIVGLVIWQVRSLFNARPLFMGNTTKITGYIIERRMTPKFKDLVPKLIYQYQIADSTYYGSYFPKLVGIRKGDSLILEISERNPGNSYVIGIYP